MKFKAGFLMRCVNPVENTGLKKDLIYTCLGAKDGQVKVTVAMDNHLWIDENSFVGALDVEEMD